MQIFTFAEFSNTFPKLLPYIGIILALIALPQGIVSLVQKRPGKGLAIAGIITGIFGILLSILFILVYVVAVLAL